MLKAGRLLLFGDVFRVSTTSVSIQHVRYIGKAKGKAKQEGSRQRRRPQKTRKNRQRKSNLDHVIEQSQDVLSLARPFSIYHPPPHITPELADDIVLYKDGECC